LKGIIYSRPSKALVTYTDELAFGATYKPEENLILIRSPLINHPKYDLPAVFVHELNGGSQQENESAESAHAISQDFQESYGVTPEYIRIETQLGTVGRNRGSTILLKAVSVSSGEILKIYLEKSTHGTAEVERSIRASRLELGPKVIYVRGNTIVEYYAGKDTDLRQRSPQLTSQEQQIVGMHLAEKLYLMFDMTNPDQVAHAFEALSDHLCIVGNGKHIDVIWIDWGRNKFVDTKNRAEQLEDHLQVLVDAIKAFLEPEVCAYFLIRLRELTAQRGEDAFFDELCRNIRKAMTEPEAYNLTRVVLAPSYQRFFTQVDAIIERIEGKEQNHPTVAEDVTLSTTIPAATLVGSAAAPGLLHAGDLPP